MSKALPGCLAWLAGLLLVAGLALAETPDDTAGEADGEAAEITAAPAAPGAPATAAADPIAAKHQFGFVARPSEGSPGVYGGYTKGCLSGAAMLPIDGPNWQVMRLSRNRNWAHPHLVDLLQRLTMDLRSKDDWPGLLIGDMSQPRGGPMLTGHKSHQTGLDADIWYKPMPAKQLSWQEREVLEPLLLAEHNGTAVIAENWSPGFVKLLRRAASYPEVERILVHPAVKKALCDATPAAGRAWLQKIRPTFLHNYHFHLRIGCPADSTGCVAQKPTVPGDGCGKPLEDWLKLVSRPPKPAPKPDPTKPKKPPVKPRVVTLADLPKHCSTVLLMDNPDMARPAAPVVGKVPVPYPPAAVELAQP